MDVAQRFIAKARLDPRVIVLPESGDERILRATEICVREGIADPVLLGEESEVRTQAVSLGLDLPSVRIVNPVSASELNRYVKVYREVRVRKNVGERVALRILRKPLYFGAMMVRLGDADGMVAGAKTITASVIRAGELVVGLQEDISTPSSIFLMEIPGFRGGEEGVLLFSDAAVNADPSPRQLAEIAVTSARTARTLLGWEPRVAMLSFSTKGSAAHRLVEKVVEATEMARRMDPGLLVDGELQADAALIPEVARRKVKESSVAGRANILIFPDLNAGNISYKLVQHLGGARAYGPILQGFRRPLSDLSRGASVEDVVGAISMLVVQAQRQAASR